MGELKRLLLDWIERFPPLVRLREVAGFLAAFVFEDLPVAVVFFVAFFFAMTCSA